MGDNKLKAGSVAGAAGDYLEKHNVYHMFEGLMQQLIIHKPADPIQFLIDQLTHPLPQRLIILGAPASGKGTQCEFIVKKYHVLHLSTGDILREQVRLETPVGLSVKKYLDNGALVPDDLIIDVVLAKLNSPECQKTGWLLDGFPRTRAQALALQAAGIFADKVILLEVPDGILVERVEGRRTDPVTGTIYHTKFNPAPEDIASRLTQRSDDTAEKVKARLASYHGNLKGVKDCYASDIGLIDANRHKDLIFKDIVEYIEQVPAKGPRKALRILFIGPPGAGKRTQAEVLSAKYGFVHVNVQKLIKTSFDKGHADKEQEIANLVKTKVTGDNNGWLIEGIPASTSMLRALEKSGLIPNKVIFLDVSAEEARSRIDNRRVDPPTGLFYNITHTPSAEIAKRLQKHPDDDETTINSLLQEYKESESDLKKFYQHNSKVIDASQPTQKVQQLVEDFIRA